MRKWVVRIVIVVALLVVIVIGVVSIGDARVYLTGEKLTAHVDRCGSGSRSMGAGSSGIIAAPEARRGGGGGGGSRSSSSTCYGTWTYRDGRIGKGELSGVNSRAGLNVVVRAKGDSAVADSLWKNLLGPVAGLIALIILIVLGIRWSRRSGSGGGPSGSGAPPAGHQHAPPAGHQQWGQQAPVGAPAPYGAQQPAPYGSPQYGAPQPQQWQQPVAGYPQPGGGYSAPGGYPQAGGYPPPGQYSPPGSPGAYQPHA